MGASGADLASRSSPHRQDIRRIYLARSARGLGSGYFAVVLGIELHRQGLSGISAGLVVAALLAGSAFALVGVKRFSDGMGRRRFYVGGFFVQAAVALVLVFSAWWWVLLPVGLTGVLSTEVIDSGPFGALEQVMLATAVTEDRRLQSFSRYGAVGTASGAIGALGAGLIQLARLGAITRASYLPLVVFALFASVTAWGLSAEVENSPADTAPERPLTKSASQPSSATRQIVNRLAGLFALDSFGAGFTVQAFVAYWLAARFNASALAIGTLFLGIGVLQTISMMVAGRLGKRFGLLQTMVFTHLPSNLFLAAIAFAPNLVVASVLLCLRASLSQMDIPTRNAYVMALVPPQDRTHAASTTSIARLVARPAGPILGGAAQTLALGSPFLISGTLKAIYDLALWRWFRKVPLTGETEQQVDPSAQAKGPVPVRAT